MAVRLVVRHPKSAAGEAGEMSFEFEQARVVIGRSPHADVRLPGLGVSETHATILQQAGDYALRDERSLNGTALNGVQLVPSRPRPLDDGDEIEIAEFTLHFTRAGLARRATTPERTASLARRMLRELLGAEHTANHPPSLQVTAGPDLGTRIELAEAPSTIVIGRGHEAELVLSDVDVSRAHLEVERDLDGAIVRDLDSKNGLEINGRRLRERRLKHGDVLRIGATTMRYDDPSEQALRSLEQQPVETVTRPRATTATAAPEQPPEPEPEPEPEPTIEPESSRAPAAIDYLVYALALLVLAASVTGLVWLLT
jgi:pSer/pThr/pTyr-binding forkhead associated (FHA) protein